MTLLIVSFLAGVLTVMAPCVLPLLPIIVGGSIAGDHKANWFKPIIIAGSLAASITIFTLLLKATTSLLGVSTAVWNSLSAIILLLLGCSLVFPSAWESLAARFKFGIKANALLGKSYSKKGYSRDVLIGASLGPVFSSCSPTYALIVAAILPKSFALGLLYLVAYSLGLALTLLLISVAGQSLANKLAWLSNPHGWFMRTIGILFIITGITVFFGLDKQLQAYVIGQGWYDPVSKFEQQLFN